MWNRASLMWREIQVPSRGPNCHLSIVTSCKVILDSGFDAVDSELFQVLAWMPDFLSVEPQSLDFRFLELNPGFQSPGFLILHAKSFGIPESRITLHGAIIVIN